MVERRQSNHCLADGVLAHAVAQWLLALGLSAGNAAGKNNEGVVVEVKVGVAQELIGLVGIGRITSGTLKGVTLAARLNIMASDGY